MRIWTSNQRPVELIARQDCQPAGSSALSEPPRFRLEIAPDHTFSLFFDQPEAIRLAEFILQSVCDAAKVVKSTTPAESTLHKNLLEGALMLAYEDRWHEAARLLDQGPSAVKTENVKGPDIKIQYIDLGNPDELTVLCVANDKVEIASFTDVRDELISGWADCEGLQACPHCSEYVEQTDDPRCPSCSLDRRIDPDGDDDI